MNQKHLIVFTLFYPYTHQGTSYDENITLQIKKFSETFDRLTIISLSTGHDGMLEVPKNTTVINMDVSVSKFDLLMLFRVMFKFFFWRELFRILFVYHLNFSPSIIKSLSVFSIRMLKYKRQVNQFLLTTDSSSKTIYSHWSFEYTMAACLLKSKYPLKVATRYHSLDIYFERYKEKYIPFRSFIFNRCDLNFFISKHGLNYFFEHNKIAPDIQKRAVINYLGTEEQRTRPEPDLKKIILLSNAWIQPLKRIELIINAIALIEQIDVEWIHIGDDYDTGLFQKIKKIASDKLGGKVNVKYEFVGRKNLLEIKEIFISKRINLFINTSITEGVPISMMEALSFGVPLIGTAVGGVPEIIENEYNGFLLPENPSPEKIASVFEHYFMLPPEAKITMTRNARNTWNEKFNSSKNYEETAVLLKNL